MDSYLPPMIIYKAERSYPECEQDGVEGAKYDASDSGWFDMVTFEKWLNDSNIVRLFRTLRCEN